MKRLLAACAALLALAAHAQFTVGTGKTASPTTPDTAMPAGKIYIDLTTLPKRRAARSTQRSRIHCVGAYNTGSCTIASNLVPNRYSGTVSSFDDHNSGSFRVLCTLSHVAFDDPIVWPGQSGRTHLHQFFGNDSTRSSSDLANMATSGKSTCHGGTLNRSGYWSPVIIYHRPGNARDGEVQPADEANFYYKQASYFSSDTGGFGGTPLRWPPPGFRMISGNPNNVIGALNGARFWFQCFVGGGAMLRTDHIPTTAEVIADGRGCDDLEMTVAFNDCWDGVNLDVPTHGIDETLGVTHITASDFNNGCTNASYPVLFPTITLNMHTVVPAIADLDYWRLSSDIPKAEAAATYPAQCTSANNFCAGRSIHSDWVNGWSTAPINGWGISVTDAILKECYRVGWAGPPAPQHSDCHDDLLGSPLNDNNWWRLY